MLRTPKNPRTTSVYKLLLKPIGLRASIPRKLHTLHPAVPCWLNALQQLPRQP
jgi:hypothetical protein